MANEGVIQQEFSFLEARRFDLRGSAMAVPHELDNLPVPPSSFGAGAV